MTEQIDQFFNPDGTLISIPVKSAKLLTLGFCLCINVHNLFNSVYKEIDLGLI